MMIGKSSLNGRPGTRMENVFGHVYEPLTLLTYRNPVTKEKMCYNRIQIKFRRSTYGV